MKQITCMVCGKTVSTPVPADTLFRAFCCCPECFEIIPISEHDFAAWSNQCKVLRDISEPAPSPRAEKSEE